MPSFGFGTPQRAPCSLSSKLHPFRQRTQQTVASGSSSGTILLMQQTSSTELSRDCKATRIPAGDAVILAAQTPVDIVQSLGGSFTVRAMDGLFRIASEDADALGIESSAAATASNTTHAQ